MYGGGGGGRKPPTKPAAAPPKDALEALMNGETPDKKALEFPSQDSEPQDRYGDSYRYPSRGGSSGYSAYDDYGEPRRQQGGTLDSVKQGAVKSGTFVKDKTVAGATYLKERDWSKEKEMAGKAGQATKTGAIYVGSNVAKGASWLWKSGKSGVDSLRGGKPGEAPPKK